MGATNPLDDRKERILREIVEGYVRLGEPVGSRLVADATDLGVSSATIRNEMAILEREGYISHPHTSAGRTPTDKGYRYYVDVLAPKVAGEPTRRKEIERNLVGAMSALDDLLERTSQILAELTEYTSLAAMPSFEESRLSRIELVRLGGHRILLVCVGDDGWHDDRLVELESEPGEEQLSDATRLVNAVIGNSTLSSAAAAVGDLVVPPDLQPVMRGIKEGLLSVTRSPGRVYTGGTANLVVWEPADTAHRVIEMLEGGTVGPLLTLPAPDAVTVRIGKELALGDIRDLSLIVASYQLGKRAGTLGVLGPTRMDYPAVISTVADVASTLSRLLRQIGQ